MNSYLTKQKNTIDFFNSYIHFDKISEIGMVFIAGGAITDYFLYGKLTSDVDLFCDSKETVNDIVNYYNSNGGIRILTNNEYVIQFIWNDIKIDISSTYYESPSDYIENCDFIICAVALHNKKFSYSSDYFAHIEQGVIGINNITRPYQLLKRIQKYIKKGFVISDLDNLKIINYYSSLDKKDINNIIST